MKKIISLIFATFSCLSIASAQKLQPVTIDKITGDTILKTDAQLIFSKASWSGTVGEQLRFTEMKVNQDYYLVFGLQTGKTSSFIVSEGDKAFVKLSNNEIINLLNARDAISSYSSSGFGSKKNLSYLISKVDFNKLKTSKVTFIRIQAGDNNFDYDINDKGSNKVTSLTALLLPD